MTVYFQKGRGWKYDFKHNKARYTSRYFQTKREAKRQEAEKRETLKNPQQEPTDMGFLDLVNLRLDHVKAYNSQKHYEDYFYMARRWIKQWPDTKCKQLTSDIIQKFVLERSKLSPQTANKEIRYLRATFNFGKKKHYIEDNPLDGIEFLPVEKKKKYVPPPEDIDKIISIADQNDRDYLWTIRETLGRMSEINRLNWDCVNFDQRFVTLYTRKKRGGHLTPRTVPMTQKLFDVLHTRWLHRDKSKPWVFWHRYRSSKTGEWQEGPYTERKRLMRTLCKKAGVMYFRYHAIRHAGASLMDNNNVPIGAIQEILGHENRSTTEIYLHTLSGAARNAIDVYELARRNCSGDSLSSHTQNHTHSIYKNKEGCVNKDTTF